MVTGAVPAFVPWLHRVAVAEKLAPTTAVAGPLTEVTMKSGLLITVIWLPACALLFSLSSATPSAPSPFAPPHRAVAVLAAVTLPVTVAHAPGASDGGADRTPAWKSAV